MYITAGTCCHDSNQIHWQHTSFEPGFILILTLGLRLCHELFLTGDQGFSVLSLFVEFDLRLCEWFPSSGESQLTALDRV